MSDGIAQKRQAIELVSCTHAKGKVKEKVKEMFSKNLLSGRYFAIPLFLVTQKSVCVCMKGQTTLKKLCL